MADKCFCHLNGYAVKDALAREMLAEIRAWIVENYPIKGDNIADNTITSKNIANESIYDAKLAPMCVTNEKLDLECVTNRNLARNSVTEQKIADGGVSFAKLSDEVKNLLSTSIKRKIVDVLPNPEGEILGGINTTITGVVAGNVVNIPWTKFVTPIDATPVTSYNRLRFTVKFTRDDGQGTISGGQVRLRRYLNGVERMTSYNLNGEYLGKGEIEYDFPLSWFEGAFDESYEDIFSNIEEFALYTYIRDDDASGHTYTMEISNVRIVNTDYTTPVDGKPWIDLYTIYMVPSANPEDGNMYDEFMYINGKWEQIGIVKKG